MEYRDQARGSKGLQIYFLVIGLVFVYLPWSFLWPEATMLPDPLKILFDNILARGLVSGFGLVLLYGSFLEILYERSRYKN